MLRVSQRTRRKCAKITASAKLEGSAYLLIAYGGANHLQVALLRSNGLVVRNLYPTWLRIGRNLSTLTLERASDP